MLMNKKFNHLLAQSISRGISFFIGLNILTMAVFAAESVKNAAPLSLEWIESDSTTRPWSYWWWMGSAVDKTNITRELETLKKAGWGGVHIIPIYGAKGWEDRFIEYLSPKWMEMLNYTIQEAKRLDMQVDMTLGTGWCFGSPTVDDIYANARLNQKVTEVGAGTNYIEKFGKALPQAVVAFGADGSIVELTNQIDKDGVIRWTPERGQWRVYAISQQPSGVRVKRAAPGGAGPMLNLIYPKAIEHYLKWFDTAFSKYNGLMPRAVYHDSYEYRSEWAPDFLDQFEKRRGYKLQRELPALLSKDNKERTARVRCDYRETVSDVMIEESIPIWVKWSKERGFLTRNEAHGSPANLLDLYALADIPETEMFFKDRRTLIAKFASSAGHIAGRNLISAETGTWLKEHFTETLADIKELLDQMFVSGVNHIFFHGTCYSPAEAPWPGWLFYASTEMNQRNSIWRDVPAVSAYIARCQAILQNGDPANDLLIYWPIYDVWSKLDGLLPHLTIHGANWFLSEPINDVATRLWTNSYSFDYISDRQIRALKCIDNALIPPSNLKYQAVIVPQCTYMPLETFSSLLKLAEQGGIIIFDGKLPDTVPGWGNLSERLNQFKSLQSKIIFNRDTGALKTANFGKGKIYVGSIEKALGVIKTPRHFYSGSATLEYIGRRYIGGWHYFVVNKQTDVVTDWFDTGVSGESVILLNPMTGESGVAETRKTRDGKTEVFLCLEPGESIIVRILERTRASGNPYRFYQPDNLAHAIKGNWEVKFIEGGPVLPPAKTISNLVSWTEFGGEDYERFAGTARYTIAFDLPFEPSGTYFVDLGAVCQSARVKLNGADYGTLIMKPFRIKTDKLRKNNNILEVEVTNISANRIRDLDRRKVQWKYFYDINFVNINYKPFDASNWDITASGLLGPVSVSGAKIVKPG